MSSIFEAFARKPRAQGLPPVALTVKVESFDVSDKDPTKHFVLGTDMITNEKVRVSLREDEDAPSRKRPRPEVKDYATGKGAHGPKLLVQPGGAMRFDLSWPAREQTDGVKTYTANWPVALSRTPDEATVTVRLARVIPRPGDEAKGRDSQVIVDVLKAQQASVVKSEAEFVAAIDAALGGQRAANGAALVRVLSPSGERGAVFITAQFDRVEKEGQQREWVLLSPKDSLERAKANEKLGPKIAAAISAVQDQNLTVEVIPATRIAMGRDTTAQQVMNGTFAKVDKAWRYEAGDDNVVLSGFRLSSVAIRQGEAGNLFISDVSAVGSAYPLYKPEDVPTKAFEGLAVQRRAEPTPDESPRP